jgi:YjbR protein
MAVTAVRVRTLALSLPHVTSYPHFDRVAFRIPQRTFATLASDGSDVNMMFDHEQQAHFCEVAPKAIAPVAGGWGRMGWTRCDLAQIDWATLSQALKSAHARASAPRPRRGGASVSASSKTGSIKVAPSKAASAKPGASKRAPSKRVTGAKRPKKST